MRTMFDPRVGVALIAFTAILLYWGDELLIGLLTVAIWLLRGFTWVLERIINLFPEKAKLLKAQKEWEAEHLDLED